MALVLSSENRQFEVYENKYQEVHAHIGRGPFVLIHTQGYLAVPRMKDKLRMVRAFFHFHHMVHIGNIIRQELANQRRSVSWLAEQLYTDRTNMYRILKKENLDTALLRRISLCLQHDFFKYYSDELSDNRTNM